MIEVACECDDGFGVPHSHVYEARRRECPDCNGHITSTDTGWVRLWVDWKEVARESQTK